MRERLASDLQALMLVPGLSGHEDRVRRAVAASLATAGVGSRSDRLGNLLATFPGDPSAPSAMVFAHMDQLGFVVRKVEVDGAVRVERLGGVPERALAAQAVTLCVAGGDLPGVIANKSHHATAPEEKRAVLPTPALRIDAGFRSGPEAEAAGVRIGTPVVYRPQALELAGGRIAGTSVDDRAGCAVLVELARRLGARTGGPTVHLVFSVQEEFNLRGAVVAAQALRPDVAIQLDLMLATDTPDMEDRGEMRLGAGPGMSLYSFHGRGTLNGIIPHPAMVRLVERAAAAAGLPLQRSAQVGVLTDLSYVQLVGEGVASVDPRLSDALLPFRAGGLRPRRPGGADAAGRARAGRDRPRLFAHEGRMTYTLGVDIGTYESKGVLADREGRIVATAARPHKMIVPQPGWAEHRADEDWWGDFAAIARELSAAVDPRGIACVAVSAIGPCMLPTDADGRPLTNGVLLRRGHACGARDRGSDRPARGGDDPRALRQRADLAIGRPEDPLAPAQPAGGLRADGQGDDLDLLSGAAPDRRGRDRPLHGRQLQPALRHRAAGLGRRPRRGDRRARGPAPADVVHGDRRPRDG
jgi:putative aminopeptidase FrvX